MSTDHQRYSIENQFAAIDQYAALNDLQIVRTYVDEGRSGVLIKGRNGLQELLADVQTNRADFEFILVYDVSRWGRFQDADESAYYEFICKAAGISVIYCAEPFENNGSMLATIIKVIKRTMAAEYSRELSMKVLRGHHRQAKQGFHQGGSPNYGLRRALVDPSNDRKRRLRDGETKNLQSDRVILEKGPDEETATVREIFRLYVTDKISVQKITERLNARGSHNQRGKPWSDSNIWKILKTERYIGTFTYGMTTSRISEKRKAIARQEWIRVENAIEPVIDRKTFELAQKRMKEWWFSDNSLLDHLTATWCTNGYLSATFLNKSKFTPNANTYLMRFGGLIEAYRMIGYKYTHAYRYARCRENIRILHRALVCRLTGESEKERTIDFDERAQVLRVGSLSIAVVVLQFLPRNNTVAPGWKLYSNHIEKCGAILLARMNKSNTKILDYYLLPRARFQRQTFLFTDATIKEFKPWRLVPLSEFYNKCVDLSSKLEKVLPASSNRLSARYADSTSVRRIVRIKPLPTN